MAPTREQQLENSPVKDFISKNINLRDDCIYLIVFFFLFCFERIFHYLQKVAPELRNRLLRQVSSMHSQLNECRMSPFRVNDRAAYDARQAEMAETGG